ncbi:DUF4011 domain-containing protein [Myxococcota bacterium]|nr:DUF4011 domain-containing protein [Myxococcota bacterium]MBU1382034.1 DUF4011 domain-containing protein [Myxococcota bacterium]MBU1495324.1 DUF4011 domain-containing protein [Myxococcota bacterium]
MVEHVEIIDIQEKRIAKWKEKLLDLSLRNRLLNFRETKTALKLEISKINLLEDKLSSSQALQLLPWPSDLLETQENKYMQPCGDVKCTDESIEIHGLGKNEIYIRLSETELEKRLKEIYRLYRSGLEETGVNTLYIACGFVNWLDPEKQQRRAPIILIPVSISRTSVRGNFEIKIYEGDSEINITLLEKFRKEYGIDISFPEIPMDEAGVDVNAIIGEFRQKLSVTGWIVEESTALGFFSFSKFLMWKDLESRTSELLNNHVVAAIASAGKIPLLNSADKKTSMNLYLPLSADSSQKEAIVEATSGNTFILEGPPGTGKSQTITNIIANCIGNGMKVLFVSEKKAALEVVYKRLRDAGLGTWCLELHSNNASRKTVLEQFENVLTKQPEKATEEFDQHYEAGRKLETKLNAFVNALHEKTPCGFSLFQTIEQLADLLEIPFVAINFGSDPELITGSRYTEMLEIVETYALSAEKEGLFSVHPFRLCNALPMENIRIEALDKLKKVSELITVSRAASTSLVEAIYAGEYKKPKHFYNMESLAALKSLGSLSEKLLPATEKLCTEERFPEARIEIEKYLDDIDEEYRLSEEVLTDFKEDLFSLNLPSFKSVIEKWMNSFFLFAFIMLFFTRWKLKKVAKGELLPNRQLPQHIDKAIKVNLLREKIAQSRDEIYLYLGYYPESNTTDKSRAVLQWAGDFRIALRNWLVSGFSPEDRSAVSDTIIKTACRREEKEWVKPVNWENLSEKLGITSEFLDAVNTLNKILHFDDSYLRNNKDIFGALENDCIPMIENIDLLRDHAFYNLCKEKMSFINCRQISAAYENDEFLAKSIVSVFKKTFLSWLFEKYSYRKQALRDYNSKVLLSDVEKFNNLENLKTKSSVCAINNKLFSKSSEISLDAPSASEAGILVREIKKKRRQMSVRNLFRTVPRLIGTLKPCILMSPLSVAQFIDPDNTFFDIVIFDEASQITVHESIGAIARAKQLVVVGDSKQLPPTAFFSKTDDEVVISEDDTEELESILDECNAGLFPSKMLRWHYRSRHESLISFSNKNYYANNLVTFPAPGIKNKLSGIELVKVEGAYYDKGHSRTNQGEAKAVVNEVLRVLKDEKEKWRSIGIVTFSIAQQRLIEDLLEDAIAENPSISVFFNASVKEPVFVKNLESVQGDERDIMLFSICYGPDEKGNFSMNFGPLNREGGERRLNVAITRAREKMIVYTSMSPFMIDVSKINSTGPAHLRAFLEFAESSSSSGNISSKTESSPIASIISQKLAPFEVVENTGRGTAPLEYGVKKLEDEHFFMGFDLEGYSWSSIHSADDRERIRPSVLAGLGWSYYRLNIMDFQTNPEHFFKKLKEIVDEHALKEALPQLLKTNFSSEVMISSKTEEIENKINKDINTITEKTINTYKIFMPEVTLDLPENIYDSAFEKLLRNELIKVIEIEGPVNTNTLARRFSAPWKISRVTKKVISRIETLLENDVKSGYVYKEDSFYSMKSFDQIQQFRVSVPAQREYDDIFPQELALGCLNIVKNSVSILKADLIKESAKQSGYVRLNKKIQEHFEKVEKILIEMEMCKIEEDRFIIVTNA